jgi:hypothetical protein
MQQNNDEEAIQLQLKLLDQQSKFEEIRKNLPPSVGLPAPLAFSAIGKAKNSSVTTTNMAAVLPKTIVTTSVAIPPANVPPMASFPPLGFPPIPVSMPGMLLTNFFIYLFKTEQINHFDFD